MLSGYFGTLCSGGELQHLLLELKSDYAAIRRQVPTAVPLWACNVALMYVLAF